MNKFDILNKYIVEFLHIEDEATNKMIDIYCRGTQKGSAPIAINLRDVSGNMEKFHIKLSERIKEKYGEIGNTAFKSSSNQYDDGPIGIENILEWDIAGQEGLDIASKVAILKKIAEETNLEIFQKGVNSLFLSIGAIEWDVPDPDDSTRLIRITTPIVIYPIKLVRTGESTPICIEFVADDVKLNPCLIEKMRAVYSNEFADGFPRPGQNEDNSIDLSTFDIDSYFCEIAAYTGKMFRGTGDREFKISNSTVAISRFNMVDIAMYYDLINHKSEINNSEIVEKIFTKVKKDEGNFYKKPILTLPADTVQENIIGRIVNGEDVIIKGPPGTGKTLTIANLISSLMAEGKKVMFVSAKTSALAEVCKKLPECLRPFVLELFYEKEKDVAGLNVNDLIKELREARDFVQSEPYDAIKQRVTAYTSNAERALRLLNSYKDYYYERPNTTTGRASYETLNNALKYNGAEKKLKSAFRGKTRAISTETFTEQQSIISTCENSLNIITDSGSRSAYRCVWYGCTSNIIPVMISDEIEDIKPQVEEMIDAIDRFIRATSVTELAEGIDLGTYYRASYGMFENDEIDKILSSDLSKHSIENLKKKIRAILNDKSLVAYDRSPFRNKLKLKETGDDLAVQMLIDSIKTLDENITVGSALEKERIIRKIEKILERDPSAFIQSIIEYNDIKDTTDSEMKSIDVLVNVLTKNRDIRDKLLRDNHDLLGKYEEKSFPKLSIFQGKAKSAYKEIANMCIGEKTPTITDVAIACKIYRDYERHEAKREETIKLIIDISDGGLTEVEIDEVAKFIKNVGSVDATRTYINNVKYDCNIVRNVIDSLDINESVASEFKALNPESLAEAVRYASEISQFELICAQVYRTIGLGEGIGNKMRRAEAVVAIRELLNQGLVRTDSNIKAIQDLQEKNSVLVEGLRRLEDFCEKHSLNERFRSRYTINLNDLRYFLSDIGSETISHACKQIQGAIAEDKTSCLGDFIKLFASGEINMPKSNGYNLTQLFEHAFYTACADDDESFYAKERGQVFKGSELREAEKTYISAIDQIAKGNAKLISHQLMVKDKNSQKYSFLNSDISQKSVSARTIFKKYSGAIKSLARCVVLSPFSVSILMKSQDYFDYDVLIVDEASQLPTRVILPCAIRSKQVVLVGDQKQMPPIVLFERTRAKTVTTGNEDDDNVAMLESVLDQAIANESFETFSLQCHYRSKNENLIAYSQKKYYKDMTTFPTLNPEKDGRGLIDVYVENAVQEKGTNRKEALKVIELIKKHFDTYYDEEAEMLKESLGVVLMGTKQQECVQGMIDDDHDLTDKISKARANAKDNPDKTYFITAVDKVQGQEIEHLIISLTYCDRNADGTLKQSFGMLNKGFYDDKLGERIFNVAVTRAIKSLTFVHSIHAREIDNDSGKSKSAQHIREYLELLESLGEKEQGTDKPKFVTNNSKVDNFARSVVEEISKNFIVEPERIVCGYGVTEKSLSIPIAILSADKTHAEIGIFCETQLKEGDRYLDNWVNYPETLEARGWKLHKMYIHDWYFNREESLESLKKAIHPYIKQ